MSKNRQVRRAGLRHGKQPGAEDEILVRSLALGLPAGERLDSHTHAWPQLLFASKGVLTVQAQAGQWVVPPQRAVWMPAGIEHRLETTGTVAMRTIYLRPDLAAACPDHCAVMSISPLLRELILHTVRSPFLVESDPAQRRLARVLVDLLQTVETEPLELPWPEDPRARRVAERIREQPGQGVRLSGLIEGSGASLRTVERLFLRETGMSLGRWRQQQRLLHALRCLAEGAAVTQVALECGYDSTSAFISMFRKSLGATPARYFHDLHSS